MFILGNGVFKLKEVQGWWSSSVIYITDTKGANVQIQSGGVNIPGGSITGSSVVKFDHGRHASVEIAVTNYTDEFEVTVKGAV